MEMIVANATQIAKNLVIICKKEDIVLKNNKYVKKSFKPVYIWAYNDTSTYLLIGYVMENVYPRCVIELLKLCVRNYVFITK